MVSLAGQRLGAVAGQLAGVHAGFDAAPDKLTIRWSEQRLRDRSRGSDHFGGLAFTGGRGEAEEGIWLTRDGETFERLLEGGSAARLYMSDIPGERAGLVRGADGLYLLKENGEGE